MDQTARYVSPLGGVTLTSDGEALTGLWFDGQRGFPELLPPERAGEALPVFTEARRWLDTYFRGTAPDFTPPLHLRGTDFQLLVWELLLAIPYGQTATYGDLAAEAARRMGVSRMSAQAVGGAVGRNPISVIVPCHRVIGANGNLTGYAGGLERKARLLSLEGGGMTDLESRGKMSCIQRGKVL